MIRHNIVPSGLHMSLKKTDEKKRLMIMLSLVFSAWVTRRSRLDQCLEGQLFNRDCDQAETWMAAREATLRDETDGGMSPEIDHS